MKAEKKPAWTHYILDASMSHEQPYCYCPIELDTDGNPASIVTGMNMIGCCPGELFGVWHPDGEQAAEEWCKQHPDWKLPNPKSKR